MTRYVAVFYLSWYLIPSACRAQACQAIRLDHISVEALECFRGSLPQHGILLEPGNAGAINGPAGAKGSFTWDSGLELLSVAITGLPVFTSCQRATSEVLDFGRACRGTDAVTQIAHDAARETWRIDSPDVRKPETAYPMIPLAPGDSVRVTAGGCAQTGGHGDTWRLYVDPQNDQIHHGAIKLPGQTSFVRLKDLRATEPYVIPSNLSNTVLRLGYEDTDHTNNGYWGRDPGPNGECRNQPNAWVEISIEHPARQRRKDNQ
jgi:hypothetical protein